MKTPQDLSIADIRMPDPARIAERRTRVISDLSEFRNALLEWLPQRIRDSAKEIAIAQTDVTLRLPKEKMAALKASIDDIIAALEVEIETEFTPLKIVDTREVSSGQIASLLDKRVDEGIRRLLFMLTPVLEKAGYKKTTSSSRRSGRGRASSSAASSCRGTC